MVDSSSLLPMHARLTRIAPAGERKTCPDRLRQTHAAKSPEANVSLDLAIQAAEPYVLDMQKRASAPTPRVLRTRAAILTAFFGLMLERRYRAIRIADLAAAAGVGRATFYEHFGGKTDAMLAAIEPILLGLSTAASGRAARPYVKGVVSHLWERRSAVRAIFSSTAAPLIQRRLAEMIRVHVERADIVTIAPAIRATGIAAAQLAVLRSWLAGEASCTTDEVTDYMIGCSKFIV